MVTSGSFPIISWWCFLAIVLLCPVASFITLKREQRRIAGGSYLKPIAALFFAEVWLWLIEAFIEGVILVTFLGFYVFLNAHGRATGEERVTAASLMIVFGSEVAPAIAGWILHRFMKHLYELIRWPQPNNGMPPPFTSLERRGSEWGGLKF